MNPRMLPIFAAVLLCLSGILPVDAGATGLGFYIGAGSGDAQTKRDLVVGGQSRDDEKVNHVGFGFALDTNLLKDQKLFNYRMNLGYERMKLKTDGFAPVNYETDVRGFSIEQDFGFGARLGEQVRLWGGPCLRLSHHRGDDQFNNEYRFWGIGVGPVMGINIGTGGPAILSVRGGYLVNGYGGNRRLATGGDYDLTASEDYFFLTFSTLFKTGE